MKKFKRDIRRTIRLTQDEDDKLTTMYKKACMTRSQWVRGKIRQARIK